MCFGNESEDSANKVHKTIEIGNHTTNVRRRRRAVTSHPPQGESIAITKVACCHVLVLGAVIILLHKMI